MCLKLKPKYHLKVTKTKTAAREDFGNLKFGREHQLSANP